VENNAQTARLRQAELPSVREFVTALLRPAPPGSVVWCTFFSEPPSPKAPWGGNGYTPDTLPAINGVNAYYRISAFRAGAADGTISSALGAGVVLLDDATTKGNEELVLGLLGEPSCKIKTSESQQWVYLLERLASNDEIKPIHSALQALGMCDKSGNSLVRYGRLPAGINNKKVYPKTYTVSFLEAHLTRRFRLSHFAALTAHVQTLKNSSGKIGPARSSDDALRNLILSGETFHDPLVQLAMRFSLRGSTLPEDVCSMLYGIMLGSKDKGTARWQERWDEIPNLVRTANEKIKERPEPQDLLRAAIAPALTADDVPPVIGAWAQAYASAAGFDASGLIASAVGAATAMLDDGIQIEIASNTHHLESARIWISLIGAPGSAKTPAIRIAVKAVIDKHKELVEEYTKDEIKRKGDLDKDSGEDDDAPPLPALMTHDCTVEKLESVLVDNPRSIIFLPEEFDAWLGAHDAYRASGGGKDRGIWLSLYDGGPRQSDRVIRGSHFIPNWGVSLLTATTPAALKRLIKKLPNDGLLQRFIVILVQPTKKPDRSVQTDALDALYEMALRKIYGYDPRDYNGGAEKRVRLNAEAQRLFDAEMDRNRDFAPDCSEISDGLASHVAKYGGMLARLTLTFHALEVPYKHPLQRLVTEASVKLAIRFLRKVFLHARVFYQDMCGGDHAYDLAQRVARYILASKLDTVTRAEIIRTQHDFRDAGALLRDQAMQILEDFGWLTPTTAPNAYNKAHATRWSVDPRVHVLYAKHGAAQLAKRERVKAAILRGEHDA
jgi:hypothetical protein